MRKNLIVITALVVLIGIILFINITFKSRLQLFETNSCDELERNINNLIEEANYCIFDEDCTLVDFGCPFGCGRYINKNINTSLINEKINLYREQCGNCIYSCVRPFNPVCKFFKCIETQAVCTPDRVYKDAWDCKCPEGTADFTWLLRETGQLARICKTITPCKGELPYEKQALSYDYKVYSYENCVEVTGLISELPDQQIGEEMTIKLCGYRRIYLPAKEGLATIKLEKIKDNTAYLLFTYMSKSSSCEISSECYTCSFTSNETPIKEFSEIKVEIKQIINYTKHSKVLLTLDDERNIKYEAEIRISSIPQKVERQNSSKQISKEQYKELIKLILDSNILSLRDSYLPEGIVANGPEYTLTIRRGDQIKSIYCYDKCPEEIVRMIEKIKELLD